VDKKYPDIIYVPEDARFDLHKQIVSWRAAKVAALSSCCRKKPMSALRVYKVRMEKPGEKPFLAAGRDRREGLLCHKPCTVSGGGKSEISKPITDAVLTGPVFGRGF